MKNMSPDELDAAMDSYFSGTSEEPTKASSSNTGVRGTKALQKLSATDMDDEMDAYFAATNPGSSEKETEEPEGEGEIEEAAAEESEQQAAEEDATEEA